ncbi:membrane-associated metallopeptidase, M50 family [Thermococcus kodakarensis KOD1]|uniref:Membrane-associated metallopeptidase, M50 family n=1 Tax=Thermococcus kodakarensis (strain ATCC BAA-918 / JCM 12380 / KOD1) TaxID=69014 RepID=Q5JGJ8_THEKO|nr:site-2 protease family protein [Thermococcus kodakarensis]WCN29309.1 site-2 protease family protein [Thermococcus kodakarensis]WCN31606.1 site-2 protease family protein [Thermococcus kodakarensis]BAD85436.1 membrane-associated metallopeptidase, M50 family [Thermococcus kodakarensis KOD1]
MPRGIYECVNCGHREVLDSTEPVIERACPKCGGDMILVGYAVSGVESPNVRSGREEVPAPEGSGVSPGVEVPRESPHGLPPEVEAKLNEFYSLRFYGFDGHVAVFEVLDIYEKNFERVLRELENLGYWAALKKRDGRIVLFVFPAGKIPPDNPWLPWLFLVLTVLSTFFAGYYLALNYIATLEHYGLPGLRNPYIIALSFSVSVMAIIGTHELGHKIAATYHGVKATMPYFIPFPNILGTLGAVIRVKSPLPTRNAAIDLGVSGPIAGFLVAVPVTVLGLKLSVLVPMSMVPSTEGGLYFGTNLLFEALQRLVLNVQGDYVIFLHPVAIAGWVGILVTFLNLIPVAQLDGGHILRAFISEKAHKMITYAAALLLVGMSYLWSGWLIWAILIIFIGSAGNPGALDEVSPISKGRIVLALTALVIFVITATPRPLWTA